MDNVDTSFVNITSSGSFVARTPDKISVVNISSSDSSESSGDEDSDQNHRGYQSRSRYDHYKNKNSSRKSSEKSSYGWTKAGGGNMRKGKETTSAKRAEIYVKKEGVTLSDSFTFEGANISKGKETPCAKGPTSSAKEGTVSLSDSFTFEGANVSKGEKKTCAKEATPSAREENVTTSDDFTFEQKPRAKKRESAGEGSGHGYSTASDDDISMEQEGEKTKYWRKEADPYVKSKNWSGRSDQKGRHERKEKKSKIAEEVFDKTAHEQEFSADNELSNEESDVGMSEEAPSDPFEEFSYAEMNIYVMSLYFSRERTLDGNQLSITLSDKELQQANAIRQRSYAETIAYNSDPVRMKNRPHHVQENVRKQIKTTLENLRVEWKMRYAQALDIMINDIEKMVDGDY